MKLLTTMKQRWTSETPSFFKGARKLALSVGTAAMSIWVANTSFSLELSETVLDFCKYAIAFCAAMGLTSQLTRVDKSTPK